jgi:hypothetical protein
VDTSRPSPRTNRTLRVPHPVHACGPGGGGGAAGGASAGWVGRRQAEREERLLLEEWYKLDENATADGRDRGVGLGALEGGDGGWGRDGEGEAAAAAAEFLGWEGRAMVLRGHERVGAEGWASTEARLRVALQRTARALFPDETADSALHDVKNTHFAQRFPPVPPLRGPAP